MSSCPIEMGVVWNEDRAISPSRVIAAVLAALQPREIPVNPWSVNNTEYVSSIWAATVAGDLAEVVSMQAGEDDPFVGPAGMWNDSIIPTNFFLMTDSNNVAKKSWQFTDSELLGNIDGLMMATEATKWERGTTLRLSQLLEMFYMGGIIETTSCLRDQFYKDQIYSRRHIIEKQTKYFTEELKKVSPSSDQDSVAMEKLVTRSYERFDIHAREILGVSACSNKPTQWPRVNLNLIFDSTYQPYNKLQLFMMLADRLDVSHYGSRMSLISGEVGTVIANSASTSGEIYSHWANASHYVKDPKNLALSKSVTSLIYLLKWRDIASSWKETLEPPYSHVTLVIGTSSTLQNKDLDSYETIQRTFLSQHPEHRLFYLSSSLNKDIFGTLNSGTYRNRSKVIALDTTNQKEVMEKLLLPILAVRRALIPNKCQGRQTTVTTYYNEVVTPQHTYKYVIEPQYLCRSENVVNIKLLNGKNGEIDLCMSREEGDDHRRTCKNSKLNQESIITINNPCKEWNPPNNKECQPIFLEIRGDRSLFNCDDGSCRRPDQIKVTLHVEGLQCVSDLIQNCNTTSKLSVNLILTIVLCSIIFFHDKLKN